MKYIQNTIHGIVDDTEINGGGSGGMSPDGGSGFVGAEGFGSI